MALARYRSFLGIAKEASRSAGVAPTPVAATDFIPVKEFTPFDNITYLDDANWRGSMTEKYGTQEGVAHSEYEYKADVFADTIGYPIVGVLGDYAVTGASAPYTHTIALKNSGTGQATSYTVSDFDAYNTRQFAGLQFGSIDFTWSADGLLEYTAKGNGYLSAVTTNPSPSFSSVIPMPVWEGTVTIAGGSKLNLQSGNLSIARPLSPIHTVYNSQNPYQIWQGAVDVTGSFVFIMEDDTELDYYLNNTQPAVVLDFSKGTGAALEQVQFTMTKCAFKSAKVNRGQDYITVDVDFNAIANTTDVGASAGFSPIKVVLKNAKSTAVFG